MPSTKSRFHLACGADRVTLGNKSGVSYSTFTRQPHVTENWNKRIRPNWPIGLASSSELDDVEVIRINDPAGDAATLAHLYNFDSVHGRSQHEALGGGSTIELRHQKIQWTQNHSISETDWSGCELVIEASGKMKSQAVLNAYLEQGVKRVVVAAPVKEGGVLNIVMGVNDDLFDPDLHPIVTAASCTTNCIAPVVKVIQENIGIVHGSITTIHDITNTQTILDAPHQDLRGLEPAA